MRKYGSELKHYLATISHNLSMYSLTNRCVILPSTGFGLSFMPVNDRSKFTQPAHFDMTVVNQEIALRSEGVVGVRTSCTDCVIDAV